MKDVNMGRFCLTRGVKMGYTLSMGARILPILLRFFIVFAIWTSVWHYIQPKNKENRVLRAFILVIALLVAAGLISMTI
jgi:hypothetical protein